MTELEPGYHRDKGTASGTETYYTVECRVNEIAGPRPRVVNGQAVTSEWCKVDSPQDRAWNSDWPKWRAMCSWGRYTYEQAQAVRWLWLVEAYKSSDGSLIDTRLVKHETKWQSTTTAVESVDERLAFQRREATE